MEKNRVLDIIINLLIGIKQQNRLVEQSCINENIILNECAYLLNQMIRQYQLPPNHYFVSEKAQLLWEQISSDSIFNYSYRDKVTKNTHGDIVIDKFRGSERTPYITTTISQGDKFVFNDVFTDEHIVTVNNIIEELLALAEYDYASIEKVLNKIYICKMLKSEDHAITRKKNRPIDYREVIAFDYADADIKVKDFDYKTALESLIEDCKNELKKLGCEPS